MHAEELVSVGTAVAGQHTWLVCGVQVGTVSGGAGLGEPHVPHFSPQFLVVVDPVPSATQVSLLGPHPHVGG